MHRFTCDYEEGCLPEILRMMEDTNYVQTPGYGTDEYCGRARDMIRAFCSAPDADVHFLVGGTQANLTVISAFLRPWQGVLSARTGHINVHETGAIEATGHKVLALESPDGKVSARALKAALDAHFGDPHSEHTVQPGMLYISFPTENGQLYSLSELTDLSRICREAGIPLYLDGARMSYGLTSDACDLTAGDIARLCDVFYIGGTKCGALFGEALVITNEAFKKDFRYMIKQRGGMLAKGRMLGLQFIGLMEDGRYLTAAAKANRQAQTIRAAFEERGIPFLIPSPTNQQFPILTDGQLEALAPDFSWDFWEKTPDGRNAVRFCTSWATTDEAVEALVRTIQVLDPAGGLRQ